MHFKKPNSRLNKKQIGAYVPPEMSNLLRIYMKQKDLTLQEALALAVNKEIENYDRGPILRVARDRFMQRKKSVAEIKKDTVAECRQGKKRVAAFYQNSEVERLKAFAKEHGIAIEHVIVQGLQKILNIH